MGSIMPTAASRSRAMVAAVVLGTALSAGGNRSAAAELAVRNSNKQAVPAGPCPEAVRDIGRYCQACWRNARLPADKWADCTQQVYVRLLERVDPQNWPLALAADGEDRREFLRAIDTVKKRAQRARRFADLTPDVAARPPAGVSRDEREAVWQAAGAVLTDRQRRIVELTADGWATPDIATALNTTPERVSDEKYKAVRKLRAELGVGT
jgi:DNA-binding CsgD family transcriptional regulator